MQGLTYTPRGAQKRKTAKKLKGERKWPENKNIFKYPQAAIMGSRENENFRTLVAY